MCRYGRASTRWRTCSVGEGCVRRLVGEPPLGGAEIPCLMMTRAWETGLRVIGPGFLGEHRSISDGCAVQTAMQVSRLDDLAARRDAVGHYNGSGGVEPRRAQRFAVCHLRYVVDIICIAGQVSPFRGSFRHPAPQGQPQPGFAVAHARHRSSGDSRSHGTDHQGPDGYRADSRRSKRSA